MENNSIISPDLIQAYTLTNYNVLGEKPFVLNIGSLSPEMRDLFSELDCSGAAYLTAWNPYSQSTDASKNHELQSLLAEDFVLRNWKFIEGYGKDAQGEWPAEPSYLVFGLSFDEAKGLANKFEQNAFVWIDGSLVPELVLMR